MFQVPKVVAAFAMLLASPSLAARPAASAPPAFIPVGEIADAPFGFVEMCQRDRVTCAAGGVLTEPVQSAADAACKAGAGPACTAMPDVSLYGTAATALKSLPSASWKAMDRRGDPMLAQVRAINAAVNRAVIQVSDRQATGQDERWQRPNPAARPIGDCEDIAIEKRMRLIDAGVPADRLFFVVAFHARFGLHTVLVARLADGDRVLDSLSGDLRRWSDLSYTWLRQQEPGRPMVWHRIGRADTAQRGAIGQDEATLAS